MKNELLLQLAAPFHPSRITWKPQAMTKDKTKAMAVAYADPRAYQNRLDEVCGMDWAVSFTPWGDRIICHLTIGGVTRSSTGEADSQSERSEIAGTAAESQAFKRACAMFGLGRYLYSLPALWVEFDGNGFTEKAKARLNSSILQHYQRWQQGQKDAELEVVGAGGEEPADEWAAIPGATDPDQELVQMFEQAGQELYGEQWPNVREHNIKRVTGGKPETLKVADVQTLLNGLKTLRAKRANGVTAK